MSTDLHLAGGSPATAEVDAVVIGLLPADDGQERPRLASGADGDRRGVRRRGRARRPARRGRAPPARPTRSSSCPRAARSPRRCWSRSGSAQPDEGGEPSAEQVRRASGAAARALAGTARAVSTLGRLDLAAAAEGTLLGAYTFTAYRSNGGGRAPVGTVGAARRRTRRRRGRRCAPRPPSPRPCAPRATWSTPRRTTCSPSRSPPAPASWPRPPGVEVEVLDDDRAAPRAATAACSGVGSGSSRQPRLVRLRYVGRVRARARRSRWSARASRSTPAASRSSPPRTWTT